MDSQLLSHEYSILSHNLQASNRPRPQNDQLGLFDSFHSQELETVDTNDTTNSDANGFEERRSKVPEQHLRNQLSTQLLMQSKQKQFPKREVRGERIEPKHIPLKYSTVEEYANEKLVRSERGKLDTFVRTDRLPMGYANKSTSQGNLIRYAAQRDQHHFAIAEKRASNVVESSVIAIYKSLEDGGTRSIGTKQHPDHRKMISIRPWLADPIKEEGIVFAAVECKSPSSPDAPEEENKIFLVGTMIHNNSFSKLLVSKIAPKDVNDRVLLDTLEQGKHAMVAFMVKDTTLAVLYTKFSENYPREVRDNTTLIHATQEKPGCNELEGYIIQDFSFGIQSLDGIVRLCVLLVSKCKTKLICRIFEMGTNLQSVTRLHTIHLGNPFVPDTFNRILMNWDYDQLVLLGSSRCDDERYCYLNFGLKCLGRFSKNKCIKMTQTPMLMNCDGSKYMLPDSTKFTCPKIQYSVKDFVNQGEFLIPDEVADPPEAENGPTELLGKRQAPEPLECVPPYTERHHCEKTDPCSHKMADPTQESTSFKSSFKSSTPPSEFKAEKRPKRACPKPREVTMEESLNRGNWALALTAPCSDFLGQITIGNFGICTNWRNFREPKADIDPNLDDAGFQTIEYVKNFNRKTGKWETDGSVILAQGLRNILNLNFEQLENSCSGPNGSDDRLKLSTVEIENFDSLFLND